MPLSPGTTLGPYEIQAPLGAGGMGEVYKARDTRLDRTVAIKVLPEHVASDPDLKQRFEREAKTISSLNHPHICTLYDIGSQDGIDFLVMEYLDGETLAQRLTKGALPLDQALKVAIEIADALDKAHRQGITHRDLKPGNIMLTTAGAKLLDFGLAKLKAGHDAPVGVSAPTVSAGLTSEGAILGTLQYMAPEQLEGKDADARTDIFAFGMTVYEMVTGKKAFEGKSQASLIAAIMHVDPPALSTLQPITPPALDHVVKTCLTKDPDGRWQTAGDVGRHLKWITEGGSQPSVTSSVTVAPQRAGWRHAVPIAAASAAMAALIGSVAVWSLMRPEPPTLQRFVITTPPDGPLVPSVSYADVAISPDGTHVVYVSSVGGPSGRHLYVRALDEVTPTPLRGTERGSVPFFSPDGASVGFRDQDNFLKRVSVLGGPAVTICPLGGNPRGMSWAADGTIVFATVASRGLLRVPEVGGEPEALTTVDPEQDETDHVWPEVLPNAKGVLFAAWSGSDETSRIAVVSLETGDVTYLLTGGSNPQYSPTGHIVYSGDGTLWAVGFDADRLELTSTNPVPVVQNVQTKSAGAGNFSLADDGSLVYVVGAAGGGAERTLVWADRQGNETLLNLQETRSYRSPRLSPDGTRLAVTVGEQDVNVDVWVSDLAALGTLRRLTTDPGFDGPPLWTPDGERVVFASEREGSQGLFSMAWDGTGDAERLMILEDAQNLQPYGWSPDGALLFEYRTTASTSSDIGMLPMDEDGAWEPLLDTDANERAPVISPDGQWIAYMSDRTGDFEIYVERFPELGGEQLISRGGGNSPVWSQDGRELFYRRFPGELMVMPVELGPTVQAGIADTLFDFGPYVGPSFNPRSWDVSPNGERLLMIKRASAATADAEGRLEIILIQNWHEELKRLVPVD